MKVNIGTLEITDEQLYGIGLVEGEFRKATRREVSALLNQLVTEKLNELAEPVAQLTKAYNLSTNNDGNSSTE